MNCSRLVTLKNSKFIFAFLVFLGGAPVHADLKEAMGPSGSLRAGYWQKDKSFSNERDYFVESAWLTLKPREVAGTQFYFEGYLQNSNGSRKDQAYGDLREGYAESSVGNLDLKIGRQIIVWGRADKFNPTDSFSTKDLTFLSSDDEDQRRGQFASQLKYHWNDLKLIAIWQSEWIAPRYPIAPSSGISVSSLRPDSSQNQFGLKVDSSGGDLDWSVSYFSGYSRVPGLKLLRAGPIIDLGLEFDPIQVYGADFAANAGDYGFRGELAYTKTTSEADRDPLKPNSSLQAVFGFDRTYFENFNLNVQAIYKSVDRFEDPEGITDANQRTLAQRTALISGQKYKEDYGISLRPGYKMLNETLEFEVAYIGWQRNGDSLLKPKITYAIRDNLKGIVGGEFYNGPSETLFGQLKDTSSGFAELRFLF